MSYQTERNLRSAIDAIVRNREGYQRTVETIRNDADLNDGARHQRMEAAKTDAWQRDKELRAAYEAAKEAHRRDLLSSAFAPSKDETAWRLAKQEASSALEAGDNRLTRLATQAIETGDRTLVAACGLVAYERKAWGLLQTLGDQDATIKELVAYESELGEAASRQTQFTVRQHLRPPAAGLSI